MIFKLCFQNEIHRCSSPPKDFSDLQALLTRTFRTELPQDYTIHYTIPGVDENAPLMSQEDYEALLSKNPAGPVKVFIKEKKEQERINLERPNEQKVQKEAVEEDPRRDSNLESFVEILAEDVIVPQVQKYPYFSHNEVQDDQIRKIVRETLKDQLPFIISQVKEAILKELQPAQPVLPPVVEKVDDVAKDVGSQCHLEDNAGESEALLEQAEEKKPQQIPFAHKVKNFGRNLKNQIFGLPGKAKNAMDDLSQKIDGDPLVECEEGRFPRSVVEKTAQLKEIFPEEEKKNLLDLVLKCPRYATLTQLADYYIRKGEPQQEDAEDVNENDENVAEEDNQREGQYAC